MLLIYGKPTIRILARSRRSTPAPAPHSSRSGTILGIPLVPVWRIAGDVSASRGRRRLEAESERVTNRFRSSHSDMGLAAQPIDNSGTARPLSDLNVAQLTPLFSRDTEQSMSTCMVTRTGTLFTISRSFVF